MLDLFSSGCKRRFLRGAVLAAAAVASPSFAAIIDTGILPTPIAIPATTAGVYLNFVTGLTGTSPAAVPGWDINPYGATNRQVLWPATPTDTAGCARDTAAPECLLLVNGDLVSSGRTFTRSTSAPTSFRRAGISTMGFRFFNETTSAMNYGYVEFSVDAPSTTGVPGLIIRYVYDNTGAAITVAPIVPPNAAPTITAAAGLTRTQGSLSANSTIANVTDDGGNGSVAVIGAGTVNGITLSNIVNTAGTITGDLVASCSATTAAFTLTATDLGSLTAMSKLDVAATANTAPAQGTYGNASVAVGAGTTVTPSSPPSDTGTLASIAVAAPGFGGTLSVNQGTGVVTVSNAGPAAAYAVTVTATDNCGLASIRTFTLNVTGSSAGDPTITPAAISRAAGSPFYRSVIANVSDAGGAGSVTVTVNGGSSANVGGTEIKAIQNVNGVISAAVRGGCFSTGTINFTLTASNGSASNSATLPVTVVAGGNPSWCAWWPR